VAVPEAFAAVCCGDNGVVVGAEAILRRAGAGADMDFLATIAAYLPPPHAGADVAAISRATCPGDLRPFG